MRLEDFDYRLPPDRVAQAPAGRRDASRLLVLDRSVPELVETTFAWRNGVFVFEPASQGTGPAVALLNARAACRPAAMNA